MDKKIITLRKTRLPNAEKIYPYLIKIDNNQTYSNRGPVVCELEERFEQLYSLQRGNVTVVNNGTAALAIGLMASGAMPGQLCILPSYTFVGTAVAVIMAGLKPYFVDVDLDTWMITPEIAYEALNKSTEKVFSVVPVSFFGLPIDEHEWDTFSEKTGLKVVYDAAWCFDSPPIGNDSVTIISLHASKAFGIGEGGLILSENSEYINKAISLANFGYDKGRIDYAGINGKLSEYAAAVAHASLDEWPELRSKTVELQKLYLKYLPNQNGYEINKNQTDEFIWSSLPIKSNNALKISRIFEENDIETRFWWGNPCHKHKAFSNYPKRDLNITQLLSSSILNLPFWPDMAEDDVIKVTKTLSLSLS